MPKNDKLSAMERLWQLMRNLTINRSNDPNARWDKTSELTRQLNDDGFNVSVRTVQRDLKALAQIFPIEMNDKNPQEFGWRWKKGASLDIPGMTTEEALMISLTEKHLNAVLPIGTIDRLQTLFKTAQQKLEFKSDTKPTQYRAWLNKIRIVTPNLPMNAPIIDHGVQVSIYEALLKNKQIEAVYTPFNTNEKKEYLLHPLGLIVRGNIKYLVASAWDYEEALLYALHRFTEANLLDLGAKGPKDFNLDHAIVNGLAEFAQIGESIDLTLRCNMQLINHLKETPLASNQKTIKDGDSFLLTATLHNSWQLRWWILSQSASVEVVGPESLRQEIKASLIEAANLYSSSTKVN